MQKDLILERWCQLAGILTEQDDLYVFDFDDTLGVSDAPTLVAASDYNGEDASDDESFEAVPDLASRIKKVVPGVGKVDIDVPGVSSGKLSTGPSSLQGSEVISLDTAQYRDWKEKYVPSRDVVRIVVDDDTEGGIKKAAKELGKAGEINVVDYSPSSTLGSAKPIKNTLDILSRAGEEGNKTAVVTARKGTTNLDTFSGQKVPSQNASDIKKFVSDESGQSPDAVIGAADISNDTAAVKKDVIKKMASPKSIKNIFFFDDDPENAASVAELGDDPDLAGKELNIFNYDFADGEKPTKPTYKKKITAKNEALRRLIKSLIAETIRK